MMSLTSPAIVLASLAFVSAAIATPPLTHRVQAHSIARSFRRAQTPSPADTRLSGDYDYYVMLGAAPNGGFEARRRMGFAHFDGAFEEGAWFKRRNGARLFTITKVMVKGDLITLSLDNGSKIMAALRGDVIEGQIDRDAKPIDRIWLVKRKEPISWELSDALWPGDNSRPTFQVTVDP